MRPSSTYFLDKDFFNIKNHNNIKELKKNQSSKSIHINHGLEIVHLKENDPLILLTK